MVIGSGGREHALVWKLGQSPEVSALFCAPGNGGTSEIAEPIDINSEDIEALAEVAESKDIDLTIVGPEAPLAKGIVDVFEKRGLRIFGPTKAAAKLEASKAFSKNLMKKYKVPTAQFAVFDEPQAARAYVRQIGAPIVVKADGLCGGKGTIIANNLSEALGAIDLLMEDRIFKQAGERIIVEERLIGDELSVIVITDGTNAVPLVSAQDHKRLLDNDKGPNTGGMGAYAPVPAVSDETIKQIMDQVIRPTLKGLAAEGIGFKGVMYAGLIMTQEGPKVLEYNARFGDPEMQVIVPLLKDDLVSIIDDTVEGRLSQDSFSWEEKSCVGVVIASGGYPGEFAIGKEIRGLDRLKSQQDTVVFHAGTRREANKLLSWGGRVLNVVAWDSDLEGAVKKAYDAISEIHFEGMTYRKDIAWRALKKPVSKK
jgi:phosphoribosylamine--glycine ligase